MKIFVDIPRKHWRRFKVKKATAIEKWISWSCKLLASFGNSIHGLSINGRKNMKKIQCKTNNVELYFQSNVNCSVKTGQEKKGRRLWIDGHLTHSIILSPLRGYFNRRPLKRLQTNLLVHLLAQNLSCKYCSNIV